MEEHFSKLNYKVLVLEGTLLPPPLYSLLHSSGEGICGDIIMCSYSNKWFHCEAVILTPGCSLACSSGWLSLSKMSLPGAIYCFHQGYTCLRSHFLHEFMFMAFITHSLCIMMIFQAPFYSFLLGLKPFC